MLGAGRNSRQLLGGKLSGATHILMAVGVLKSYGGSWVLHDTSCAGGGLDVGLKTGVETDARDVDWSVWSLGK